MFTLIHQCLQQLYTISYDLKTTPYILFMDIVYKYIDWETMHVGIYIIQRFP